MILHKNNEKMTRFFVFWNIFCNFAGRIENIKV